MIKYGCNWLYKCLRLSYHLDASAVTYQTCDFNVTNCDSCVGDNAVFTLVLRLCTNINDDMTTVSPFARSSAFDEPRLGGREQTVSPSCFYHPISAA